MAKRLTARRDLTRRPRSSGTTSARRAFQCRVADLVDSTAPELNAAGVLQGPVAIPPTRIGGAS